MSTYGQQSSNTDRGGRQVAMSRQFPVRRVGALLASAALLASLTAATVAAPTAAAKPRCAGKVATIVGTKKADVIRGTKQGRCHRGARRGNDTVRGRGGNDTICGGGGKDTLYGDGGNDKVRGEAGNDTAFGGSGRDKLFGNDGNDKLWGNTAADWLFGGGGRDRLEGQGSDDALDGGPAVDVCRQGVGSGRRVRCERPVAPPPAPPAPVVPPPPPEPPTLVIAYGDVNTNHVYDAGDVLIAKIIDTKTNGDIDVGDTVKMGKYPTNPNVVKPAQLRSQYEDWQVKNTRCSRWSPGMRSRSTSGPALTALPSGTRLATQSPTKRAMGHTGSQAASRARSSTNIPPVRWTA